MGIKKNVFRNDLNKDLEEPIRLASFLKNSKKIEAYDAQKNKSIKLYITKIKGRWSPKSH